jgi:hypothetical protein
MLNEITEMLDWSIRQGDKIEEYYLDEDQERRLLQEVFDQFTMEYDEHYKPYYTLDTNDKQVIGEYRGVTLRRKY